MSSSAASLISMDSKSSWPDVIKDVEWPATGVRYSFRDRYLSPDKLSLWLHKTFGKGNAKYVRYNSHYYVMAPRKPTKKESQWLMDPDRLGGVEVDGVGFLSLAR